MTDTKEDIRKALAAATPGPWRSMRNGNQRIAEKDGRLQHVGASTVTGLPRAWNPAGIVADDPSVSRFTDADADLIASAPQWLAELLAECEALTVKRDRYLHALELVAPDGRGLQLFLGEGPAPGMPMFGRVSLVSPYLVATKPEGPDASFAGAREVYQYTYDEDTQHEAEHCTVGYFVTEDWLCERDAGAEEKNREALARAERIRRDIILSDAEYLAETARQLVYAQYGDETYSRGLNVVLSVDSGLQQAAYAWAIGVGQRVADHVLKGETVPAGLQWQFRAARLLGEADHIFHPATIPAAILSRARADAVRHVADTLPIDPPAGLSIWLAPSGDITVS